MSHYDENALLTVLEGFVWARTPEGPRKVGRPARVRELSRYLPGLRLGLTAAGLVALVAILLIARSGGSDGVAGLATAPPPAETFDNVIPSGKTVIPESPAETGSPAFPPSLLANADSVVRTKLGRGGTLGSLLDRLGIPAAEKPLWIDAIRAHINPRRLSARTGVVVARDADGRPIQLSLRTEPERFLRIRAEHGVGPMALAADWIELPVERAVEAAGGVVSHSVAQALSDSEHGRLLTEAFAEIFQWDLDLLTDPRPGDEVRVVYEAERLGQLPDDLPGFGDAASEPGEFLRIGRVLAATYDGAMARSSGYWVEGTGGVGSYYDPEGRPLRKAFLKSPLNYRRISSGFSHARRNPVTRRVVPHHGVDFAASTGTPVVATSDGRVVSAGNDGPLGLAVRVKHGTTYTTVYGHLSRFARGVRSGVEVKQNQVIGYVGSTGRATGPHLHYTLLRSGRAINPMTFENPPAEPLAAEQLPRLLQAMQRWVPVMARISPEAELDLAGDGTLADAQVRPGA